MFAPQAARSESSRTRSGESLPRRATTAARSGTTGSAVAPDLGPSAVPAGISAEAPSETELLRLFHRLNNQLGVILANAELLESRLTDETQRARAGQVVAGALDAIATIQRLRQMSGQSERPAKG